MSYYCSQKRKQSVDMLAIPTSSDNMIKKATESTSQRSASVYDSDIKLNSVELSHLPSYPPLKVPSIGPMHHSQSEICPHCKKSYRAKTRKTIGCAAKSWGAVLCLFTGVLCWVPCVIDDCKDKEIVCMNCAQVREKVPSYFC